MPIPKCRRCGKCHVGRLIFASTGFLVLFFNDWEQNTSESDLAFQLRNQIPMRRGKIASNMLRFEGMSTQF